MAAYERAKIIALQQRDFSAQIAQERRELKKQERLVRMEEAELQKAAKKETAARRKEEILQQKLERRREKEQQRLARQEVKKALFAHADFAGTVANFEDAPAARKTPTATQGAPTAHEQRNSEHAMRPTADDMDEDVQLECALLLSRMEAK